MILKSSVKFIALFIGHVIRGDQKNSNTSISRFNHQSTELQIGKPVSLMSVNELSALILSGGFKLVHCGILFMHCCFGKKETSFLERNSVHKVKKSFNGDGNFIFILYFSTSLASWFLSSFIFFSSFLESRLVGFYFEGHLKGGPVLFLFLSL